MGGRLVVWGLPRRRGPLPGHVACVRVLAWSLIKGRNHHCRQTRGRVQRCCRLG